MQKLKVSIVLEVEVIDIAEDAVREAIKYNLRDILEGDDAGEEELQYTIEDMDEDLFE